MLRAFTLIELLVTLALASLLATIAVPAFTDLIAAHRATATINDFARLIALARSSAITGRQTVTLCPDGGQRCGPRNTWHTGAITFVDRNGNRRIDVGETVIGRASSFAHGTLRWRAFRNRSYLRFQPYGLTLWQNGNFLYCPHDGDNRHARMLIVNYAGRVRVAPDRDGDGIREAANGRPITC